MGTTTLNAGGQEYQSAELIPHPRYNSFLLTGDIGLIRLDESIKFNTQVSSINLPDSDYNESGGTAVLSGWGTTSVNIPQEEMLFTR